MARLRRPDRGALLGLALGLGLAAPAAAMVVESTGPGTSVHTGQAKSDLEDPLNGDVVIGSNALCRFRDADFIDTGRFKYWTASGSGTVDGNAEEVWMRQSGQSLSVETTVASTAVAIHLAGDGNDGRGRVLVDGTEVAVIDLWSATADYAVVIVTDLADDTHTITIENLGSTLQQGATGTDVATLGAAAVTSDCPPTTTVITHGFTISGAGASAKWCGCRSEACVTEICETCFSSICGTGQPGAWVENMARAIVTAGGGDCAAVPAVGTVLEYLPGTGEWETVCGSNDAAEDVVLIFNWAQESDGLNTGGQLGYAQAAGEALYAALRDPHYVDFPASFDSLAFGRAVHFIGHSRGTVVNSECLNRIAKAGITVDQVTLLDPHPVDGDPDPVNWRDPQPRVWSKVRWADNYHRDDDCAVDFDGDPRPGHGQLAGTHDVDLEPELGDVSGACNPLQDPPFEHVKVHAWYHGTIDLAATSDGDGTTIDDGTTARSGTWYATDGSDVGYARSAYGGGNRPATTGTKPDPDHDLRTLVNGDFQLAESVGPIAYGHAGWDHHGGSPGTPGTWMSEGGNRYAKLTSGNPAIRRNRVYIDYRVGALEFDHRAPGTTGSEVINVTLRRIGQPDEVLTGNPTNGSAVTWEPIRFEIPETHRGAAYSVEIAIVGSWTLDVDRAGFILAANVPSASAPGLVGVALLLLAIGVVALAQRRTRGAILSQGFPLAVVLIMLACGQQGGESASLAMPSKESLGLSERQLARYSALSMDELVEAMEGFAENEEESQGTREAFIELYDGHWVGWAGTVRGSKVLSRGEHLDEISVAVVPPSRSRGWFAATVPILFKVPPGHPVTELGRGDVIRFAGRLEFDGRTRKPWVLDAHLLESTGER